MTEKAKKNIENTIATLSVEGMSVSDEVIGLLEEIANGNITGDEAVAEILRHYGLGNRRN